MKIGIDGRFYSESGVGRYLRNLILNLQILDKENKYFIFLLPKDFKDFNESANFKKVSANFYWYGFAEQFQLPKLLNKHNLDLMHFPHFNVPIFYNKKFVVTIHDLIHQHFQMSRATALNPLTYKIKHFGYGRVLKNAIRKSAHVLVPSNYVKAGLMDEWNINNTKVTVTPEAVDDKIVALSKRVRESESQRVLEKLKASKPYIFYVGNAHPHKNVEGLIRVFGVLKEKYPNLSLVLSGKDHYFWKRLKQENKQEGVIFTDYVSDEELVVLYKNALCFVMPSFEEGFGIPILEAMACSCVVVSSNAGALTEVGGEAALYFDPHELGDMGDKIDRVIKSEKLRQELVKRGEKRVKLFSWEKLAKQTLEVYEQCG